MTKYQEIPIHKIYPDPQQPRKIFDEEKLADLAESIKENGLIQPIGVYPGWDGFVISHGERRWRASQLVGLETIPAIIGEQPDALRRRIRQFVENAEREALSVIENAMFYRDMLQHMSMAELSRKLGRGGQTTFITNALIWLDCEDEIKTAVAAKRLPRDARVARALLEIPDSEARVKLGVALGSRKASIQACVLAAGKVAKKLKETNRPSQVKTPAISLALNGSTPNGRVNWKQTRQAALAMCDACSLKDLSQYEEPAWTLVLQAAEQTCADCTNKNGRDLAICRECPGVEIIKQLGGVVQHG